ncbi:hypothetical protein BCON_0400g00020 [Botryotinia convoluta]|uniref:Uncharacterized protein n=1 Tax=Botryotinia convoluta TaxID=54673 RepID=A0A4Z1HD64_9HELO|nr:hypothetical protein BCON_0400g00020 [Botryotinia convoluta]
MRTSYHETYLFLDANLNEPHFTTEIPEKIDSQDEFWETGMENKAASKKNNRSTHLVSDGLDTSVKSAELEVKEKAQSNGNTSIDFHPPKIGLESIESKRERGRSSSTTQRALPTVRRHSPATHPCFEDYANHMAYQPNVPRLHKTQFICFDSIMEWRESVLDEYNTFTENSLRWGVNELKVGRIPDDQSQSLNGVASAKSLETFNHYGTVFYLNIYEEEMMAACLTLVELSQPYKEKYLNISSEHDRDLILSTEQELDACFTLIGFKKERCFFASDESADLFRRAKKLRGFQRGFFDHTCEQHSTDSPQVKEIVMSDTR